MKKIFLVFILALVYSFSFGQFPSTQTSGTPSTLVKSKGAYGSDSGYVFIHSYPDTTTANYGWLKNIAGIIIRVGNELYMRNSAMTKWNIIGGGNISPNWLLTGNDVVMGQYLGSNNTVPFLLKANDTTVGFISDTLVTFGDVYGTFHDTKIDINDRDSTISLKSNGVVGLGDVAGYGRGTIFTVDDRIRAIKGTTNKFAVGSGVNANGNYSVALGYNTSANGYNSTAMGEASIAGGDFSTAMGSVNTASGDYSTAIGRSNTVSGIQSVVIGSNLTNSQDSTIKLGFTTSNLSIKAGNNLYNNIAEDSVLTTDVDGNLKLVMGGGSGDSTTLPEAYANGNRFTTSATQNMAGNDYTIDSVGLFKVNTNKIEFFENAQANNNFSTAIGLDAISDGASSVAIGESTHAYSDNSIAIGFGANAVGQSSVAFGSGNSYGYNSTSFGNATHARGDYSISGGIGTVANDSFHVAFGTFNDTTEADKLFTIGKGNDNSTRSNALQLYKNGLFQLPYYSTADTNKVAGFDANGNVVLRTKSIGKTYTATLPISINGSNVISMPKASATDSGFVNTTAQTFAGDKTLSGNTSIGGTLGVTGATTLSTLASGASTDSIVTVDASTGLLKKRSQSSVVNAWGMFGSTGTSSSTNFNGTTDATNFIIKTNNGNANYSSSSGTNTTNGTNIAIAVDGTAASNISMVTINPNAKYVGSNRDVFTVKGAGNSFTISGDGTGTISNLNTVTLGTNTIQGSSFSRFRLTNSTELLRFDYTNLSVLIGTTTNSASSLVTMESTTKGLLIPRMTTTQRDAISTPATSLLIFNTTTNAFNYYDGAAWIFLSSVKNSGSAATDGTATLSSGTATVNTTAVAAGSKILLTYQNCTSCGTIYIGTITAGTSFVINSSNGSDASTVLWSILY